MKPLETERRQARLLRLLGWSLRRIAAELDVALSSVSVWTRDVEPMRPLRTVRMPVLTGDLRRCGRCGRGLPVEFFSRNGAGRQHWCKDCFRKYFAVRGELHRNQVRVAAAARRRAARELVLDVLERSSCADCGDDRTGVLEFDHVRPGKRANVADLVARGASPNRIDRELALCDVVCVNCHRRRTAKRRPPAASRGPRSARNRAAVTDILERSCCSDCGEVDPRVLEFDHVRGQKSFPIAEAVRLECPLEALRAELAKCVVRCANCHRLRTAQRGGHFRHHQQRPRSSTA